MGEKIDSFHVNNAYETFTVVPSTIFQLYKALLQCSANSDPYTCNIPTLKLFLILLRLIAEQVT